MNSNPFPVVMGHIFSRFQVDEVEAANLAREYINLVESKLGEVVDIDEKWLRILEWHFTLRSQLKWREKALQEASMRAMAEDTAEHYVAGD